MTGDENRGCCKINFTSDSFKNIAIVDLFLVVVAVAAAAAAAAQCVCVCVCVCACVCDENKLHTRKKEKYFLNKYKKIIFPVLSVLPMKDTHTLTHIG